jgi:lysophospholipid acyltransferase (LPLAT)-like uncharacterized protein
MAHPSNLPPLAARAAAFSGRLLARYSLWALPPGRVATPGLEGWPRPAIVVCWHEGVLIALTAQSYLKDNHSGPSFVPPGLIGDIMRAWINAYGGMQPIPLPPDRRGNPAAALKLLANALRAGQDVFVAVDGPHGPPLVVRPGALWLARASGRPLVPMGLAAWPAIRWPKWDDHILPLPGARAVTLYGRPMFVARGASLDEAGRALSDELHRLSARAWQMARRPAAAGAVPKPTQETTYD